MLPSALVVTSPRNNTLLYPVSGNTHAARSRSCRRSRSAPHWPGTRGGLAPHRTGEVGRFSSRGRGLRSRSAVQVNRHLFEDLKQETQKLALSGEQLTVCALTLSYDVTGATNMHSGQSSSINLLHHLLMKRLFRHLEPSKSKHSEFWLSISGGCSEFFKHLPSSRRFHVPNIAKLRSGWFTQGVRHEAVERSSAT